MKAESRILLVEDDRGLRTLLCNRLWAAGYAVETAGNGLEALEALAREPPLAVVSDVDMPRLDGLSLCRLARRIAPDMPVVLMTAGDKAGPHWSYEQCGATDVIRKPFDGRELISILDAVLARSRSRRRRERDLVPSDGSEIG